MELQKMFKVVENTDLKRWEFTPNTNVDETSYTVAFYECDNEPDAWIALYLAISKKAKRQQTSEDKQLSIPLVSKRFLFEGRDLTNNQPFKKVIDAGNRESAIAEMEVTYPELKWVMTTEV